MVGWKSAVSTPRGLAMAVVALGGLATYLINFPGSMEYDSFVQLVEGREGFYSNWHPPVMSWLLGISDSLPGPAAGWFTGMDALVGFGALTLILLLPKKVSRATAVVAALMLLLPQLLMSQTLVVKDTLFANATLAGFTAVALADRFWPRRRWRMALIAVAATAFALAALARQNGVVVVPGAAIALGLVVWRRTGAWRTGVVYGGALVVAAGLLAFGTNAYLQRDADGSPSKEQQFKILRLYDLTGMIKREPSMRLAVFERKAPALAKILREQGVALWTPVKNDTMETDEISAAKDAVPAAVITEQWHAAMLERPWLYLRVRAELFRWVFQPPECLPCHPFHVGEEGGEEEMKELGAHTRFDARDLAMRHYGEFFMNRTPVFSHALFALLGFAAMVLMLRRSETADIVMAAMMASALVFTATFFVVSIACDYRYLYFVDLSALAGVLYVAADWNGLVPRRPRPK